MQSKSTHTQARFLGRAKRTYVRADIRTYVRWKLRARVRTYVGDLAQLTQRARPSAGDLAHSRALAYVISVHIFPRSQTFLDHAPSPGYVRTHGSYVRTPMVDGRMHKLRPPCTAYVRTYVRTSLYVRTCVRPYVRTCTRACIQRRLHLGCRASTGGSCGPPAHASVPRPTDVRMLRKIHPC